MGKKIKVFLGGFVNYLAAQNINCRSLSVHLDKSKFEVYTILYPYPNADDFVEEKDVHYIKMNRHLRSLGWLAVVQGIAKCDVVYWTKWEYATLARITAKLFGKKFFKTVEGILADSDLRKVKNPKRFLHENRVVAPYLYAITNYIRERVGKEHNFCFSNQILYLGVETAQFLNTGGRRSFSQLKNIVFVGNNLINKGIDDFFRMSVMFPDISFHIVGANNLWQGTLEEYIKSNDLHNVFYHGRLNHTELSLFLSKMDLMFFPSRAEGFPKVQLEAACAGVPTLCYDDYGAAEWITSGQNGYVVSTFDEAAENIKYLRDNPQQLRSLSLQATELGKRFDWSILVKVWEREIEHIFYGD